MRNAMGGLLLFLAVGCLPAAAAARAADDAAPINVVLITVDTLRADHVGAYGHHVDTTPTLDRLATAGVRFADATVQWPQTWPSIASLMTATYPSSTGVRYSPRRPLAHGQQTLAEILAAAGYQTAAVVGNATIGKKFAFDQGFDVFVESWVDALKKQTGGTAFENEAGKVKQLTNATVVTDQALATMRGFEAGKPFFLWLHYIDPHGPYVPPPAYAEMFANTYAAEPVEYRLLPSYQLQKTPGAATVIDDLGFYKAQYDRSIRYFDDQLSRVIAAAPAARTLFVVTADHGEGLGEHRYYLEHGAVPYQTTAHVPLLMALQGGLPAGQVVKAPVGLIDVTPTIIDILGLQPHDDFEGSSLLSLMRGNDNAAPALVFMESGRRQASQVSVRKGPWKLVHTRAPADRQRYGLPEVALYNLDSDPAETVNVIDRNAVLAAEMRAALADFDKTGAQHVKRRAPAPKIDPATKEQMRALGYGG